MSRQSALLERALHVRNTIDGMNPRTRRARRIARRRRMAGAFAAGAAITAAALTLTWRRAHSPSMQSGPHQ